MATVLVPLAQGCEELEAVTIIDLLRRAGVAVVVAGLEAGPVTASRGVVLLPEVTLDDVFTALFPCGSITGAPKLKSMDIIADLEKSARSVYCGAIGHVSPGGAARPTALAPYRVKG